MALPLQTRLAQGYRNGEPLCSHVCISTPGLVRWVIPFLDTLIEKDGRGNLQTNINRKPTATNSLLNWYSHHPTSPKRGIPKGQFLSVRRNCSRLRDFHQQSDELGRRFLQRGYPLNTLRAAHDHALQQNRTKLLTPKIKPLESKDRLTRIIATYDQRLRLSVLRADPDLRDMLQNYPQVTYRHGRSLCDRLVYSLYTPSRQEGTWLDLRPLGTFKCGKNCVACPFILQNKTFKNFKQERYIYNDTLQTALWREWYIRVYVTDPTVMWGKLNANSKAG